MVDDGARRALVERGRSLLPAGVVAVHGRFEPEDAVEIVGPDGAVFAKGLSAARRHGQPSGSGRRTEELPDDLPDEVVHRDDLVVLDLSGQLVRPPGFAPGRPG